MCKLLWGTVLHINLNCAVLALPVLTLCLCQSKAAALICAGMPRIVYPLPSCQLRLLQHIPSAHRLSWLIDRPLSGRELHTSQSFDLLELWEWARNPISIEPLRQASRTTDWRNFLLPERQYFPRDRGGVEVRIWSSADQLSYSHTQILIPSSILIKKLSTEDTCSSWSDQYFIPNERKVRGMYCILNISVLQKTASSWVLTSESVWTSLNISTTTLHLIIRVSFPVC